MATPLFIADVHLGKLARYLRLLGFDTVYNNGFTAVQLVSIAQQENRVLLSRGRMFTKVLPLLSFIILSEDPEVQLLEIVHQFKLQRQLQPFSRCLVCNGLLEPVTKETVYTELEQNTASYFQEFWQCTQCQRIYWKGSHYERMHVLLEKISGVLG